MDVLMSLNHDGKLSDFLYKAYGSRLFCDLSVVTSDQTSYETHRVVLATFSDFFHKKLKQKKGINKIQIDIDSAVFKVLLEFMYTGQLSVTTNERTSLYNATCILGIESAQELLQNAYVTSDWPVISDLNSKSINETKVTTNQESQNDSPVNDTRHHSQVKNEVTVQENVNEDVINFKSSRRIQEKNTYKGEKTVQSRSKGKSSKTEYKKSRKSRRGRGNKNSSAVIEENDTASYFFKEENVQDNDKDPDFIAAPVSSTTTRMVTRNKSSLKCVGKEVSEVKKAKICKAKKGRKHENEPSKSKRKGLQKQKDKAKHATKVDEGISSRSKRKRVTKKILVPTKNKISECPICKQPMKTPLGLRRHMAKKHVIYSVKIPKSQLLLKSSMHSNRARKFILFEAGEDFSGRPALETIEKVDKELYKCKICERKFKYYSMAKMHIEKRHLNASYLVQRRNTYRGLYKSIVEFLDMRKKAFTPKAASKRKAGKSKAKTASTNCFICEQSITEGRSYANHLRKLHDLTIEEARDVTGYPKFPVKKKTLCHECEIEFDSVKLLKEHCKTVHEVSDYSYPCPDCKSEYSALAALKSHMRWLHGKSLEEIEKYFETLIPCEVEGCDFSCGNMLTMKNHVMNTHRGVEYRCNICGFTFHVKAMLYKHKFFKHFHKESPLLHYRCETCQRKFSKRFHLRLHLFRYHGIKVGSFKTYKCTFEGCDKECTTSSGLKSHLRRHTKEKTFKCEYCNQMLKTDTTYRKHINKMHLGIRPHLCQICGQTFGEESELTSHIRNRHSNEKEFQCEHCPYATANKSTFYTHLYMVHKVRAEDDKRKIYECPHCDFTTVLGHRFKTHVNGHKNIREYRCKLCSKEFISSSTLRAHKQWAHSDKKYTCSHCSYQTKTMQKLNEHIRIQHQLKGFKPYRCPYCSFSCATGGNTRKHIKQKHKGQEVRYIRDDSLLEAARLARKSGNTTSFNFISVQPVATDTNQTYQEPDYVSSNVESSVNLENRDKTIHHGINVQTYAMISNVMDVEAASASANIDQTQSIGHGTNFTIPSHPVYKLVNGPSGIHVDGNYKSHAVQTDVSTTHLATLHSGLTPVHGGMHTQILDASEIPVNENVIVSSVHSSLQPLVSILPNHMQNL